MARVSEWTSLLPGSRVYVHYGDEDNYWHERILLAKPEAHAQQQEARREAQRQPSARSR